MILTTAAKAHHAMQSMGLRYCPIDSKEDSEIRPPQVSTHCNSRKYEGYFIYEDEGIGSLCIGYNTRCHCALTSPAIYNYMATVYLSDAFKYVLKHFPGAALLYSSKGCPYIGLGEWREQYEVSSLDYPLYNPNVQYDIQPIS